MFLKNPQGITVSSDNIFTVKGIRSGHYAIPDVTRCVKLPVTRTEATQLEWTDQTYIIQDYTYTVKTIMYNLQ